MTQKKMKPRAVQEVGVERACLMRLVSHRLGRERLPASRRLLRRRAAKSATGLAPPLAAASGALSWADLRGIRKQAIGKA